MRTFLTASLALAFTVPCPAQTTWYVDADGTAPGTGSIGDPYTSIQYAIERPSTIPGDTLIVRAGTYFENIDYAGKDIIIRSQNGLDVTMIDGGQNGSVVTFQSGETAAAVLEGFTVTNGSGSDVAPHGRVGGGLLCLRSSPSVIDCRVFDNRDCGSPGCATCVVSGGGAFLDDSDAHFTRCVFESNGAQDRGSGVAAIDSSPFFVACCWLQNSVYDGCLPWEGGGLFCEGGAPVLVDCEFLANLAEGRGGGVCGPAHVSRTRFQNNYGYEGGGAYGAVLVDCTLTENEAGGIVTGELGRGGGAASSSLARCLVVNNRAAHGGGLSWCTAIDTDILRNRAGDDFGGWGGGAEDSDLVRCVIAENVVDGFYENAPGGGIAYCSATESVIACNLADQAGGAYNGTLIRCTIVANVSTVSPGGTLGSTLMSSIVWANTSEQCSPGSVADHSNIQGGWPGTGNIDADPLFVDAPNGNFHLRPGSPCIDAGDPTLPRDLDNSRADMGAFQFVDCNDNGILDAADIASGTSADLNGNAFPDECECLAYNYCVTSAHSTGPGATMASAGTTSVSQNDLILVANDCPPNKNGIFFYGPNQSQAVFGDGFRCVFGAIKRLTIVNTGPQGTAAYAMDYTNPPQPSGLITPGSRWNFQFWFRDPSGPGGSGFNLTDGLEILFCE